MGRLKAVFFDIGGTLIDIQSDKSSHLKVLDATRIRYGLDVSKTELHKRFVTYLKRYESAQVKKWTPILQLTVQAFEDEMAKFGIKVGSRDSQWFLNTYLTSYRQGIKLMEGAIDTLRLAKQLNLHIGILSDVDDKWAQSILDKLKIRPFLDSVTTSESVGVGKPNPRIFLSALKKAKCKPAEAMHVGDSLEKDVLGAKNMGMLATHIDPDPSPAADFKIVSISELVPIIQDLVEAGT